MMHFGHDVSKTTTVWENILHAFSLDKTGPEKPQFCSLMSCVLNNTLLIELRDTSMSNWAIIKMQITSFNAFIHQVSQLGHNIWSHYKSLCGWEIPFANICHDIWQGLKKDILGVTLMFINPHNCHPYWILI